MPHDAGVLFCSLPDTCGIRVESSVVLLAVFGVLSAGVMLATSGLADDWTGLIAARTLAIRHHSLACLITLALGRWLGISVRVYSTSGHGTRWRRGENWFEFQKRSKVSSLQ